MHNIDDNIRLGKDILKKHKLIVGISGASGVIYGIRLLEVLKEMDSVEALAVISPAAFKNMEIETNYSSEEVKNLAAFVYDCHDLEAPISSGSFLTLGMVVLPCSIKSLSGIVNSYNDNLLTRAADVTLKERRKLVVVPRETPLHKGHLELMLRLIDHGGILLPPFPGFYHKPLSIMDLIDHTIGKVLDQFHIDHQLFKRWS